MGGADFPLPTVGVIRKPRRRTLTPNGVLGSLSSGRYDLPLAPLGGTVNVSQPSASLCPSEWVSNASSWRPWFVQAKDEDMRDFRDAKAMARTIREALADQGLKITVSQSLELTAKAFGFADWNTMSAAISAEPSAPPQSPLERQSFVVERPLLPGRVGFAAELEVTLHRAVASAKKRNHEYATLEHLLLALADDADASAVMRACNVDVDSIKSSLADYLDSEPNTLPSGDAMPTAAFQRVIQRSVIHVQASGRQSVDGAQIFVAIFSESESRAAHILAEHNVVREEAVKVIKGRDAAA